MQTTEIYTGQVQVGHRLKDVHTENFDRVVAIEENQTIMRLDEKMKGRVFHFPDGSFVGHIHGDKVTVEFYEGE
jgi:hypothetical protein